MTLSMIKSGDFIKILSIPDETVRSQAIRLGIYEGANVLCTQKIKSGPVILHNRFQEIAIGHSLAKEIEVTKVDIKGGRHRHRHGRGHCHGK